MKRTLISVILFMAIAVSALASGTYSTEIDNVPVTIVFTPGPFGPEESGKAELFVNGKLSGEYNYIGYDYGGVGVLIYDVQGLCWFLTINNGIDAMQPIGITLKLMNDKSIYQFK